MLIKRSRVQKPNNYFLEIFLNGVAYATPPPTLGPPLSGRNNSDEKDVW